MTDPPSEDVLTLLHAQARERQDRYDRALRAGETPDTIDKLLDDWLQTREEVAREIERRKKT